MTAGFVVDASVALKWFVTEPGSELAERFLDGPTALHAPDLLRIELGNALAKNTRAGLIRAEQASAGLSGIGRTIGSWHSLEHLLPTALSWSLSHAHPIYDFCYLALARSLGLQVVTADEAFLRKIGGRPEARYAVSLTTAVA